VRTPATGLLNCQCGAYGLPIPAQKAQVGVVTADFPLVYVVIFLYGFALICFTLLCFALYFALCFVDVKY